MPLHLIKLCVGVESVQDLADWQAGRLKQLKKAGAKPLLSHVTRTTPKRRDEILDGGSLYWVIKGYTAVRQPIVDLVAAEKQGVPHCAIVYAPELIPVARRAQRAFQGWRYLEAASAPPDLKGAALDAPPELQQALAELGLL